MSIRRAMWLGSTVLLFTACAEKTTSICGGTGECCAIGTYDAKGNASYTVFQCIAKGTCGPECRSKYDGLTSCPYSNASEGSCGVEKEIVWIWEGDFWGSRSDTQANVQLAMMQKKADDDVGKMDASSIGFCEAACKAGSATFCPIAIVPDSVSLGLLTTMGAIAKSGDLTDRRIPIASIEKNFGVENALGPCPRGDILVRSGKILNSGASACVAGVDPLKDDAKIDARLTTDPIVIADIAANPGYLTFMEEGRGFNLSMIDQGINDLFGGSLSYAATARETTMAVTLKRPAGEKQPCIGIEGLATTASSFHEAALALTKDPDVLSTAVRDAVSIVSKAGLDAQPSQDDPAIAARLLPLTTEYERLLNGPDSAAKDELTSTQYEVDIDGEKFRLSLAQALLFVDLDICQASLASISDQELPAMLPILDPAVGLSGVEMEKRERLAGEILLCRYGYKALPESLRLGMRSASEAARSR